LAINNGTLYKIGSIHYSDSTTRTSFASIDIYNRLIPFAIYNPNASSKRLIISSQGLNEITSYSVTTLTFKTGIDPSTIKYFKARSKFVLWGCK